MANLRRGKLYTFTMTGWGDYGYARIAVVNAKGTELVGRNVRGGDTSRGTVPFRPKANGTYFFTVARGFHYTLSVR